MTTIEQCDEQCMMCVDVESEALFDNINTICDDIINTRMDDIEPYHIQDQMIIIKQQLVEIKERLALAQY